jgi:hypothetical protein
VGELINFGEALCLTRNGLCLRGTPTAEEFGAVLEYLDFSHAHANWVLGDALINMENICGEDVMLQSVADKIKSVSVSHQIACRRVAEHFTYDRRRDTDKLNWSHYHVIASKKLTSEEQDALLDEAIAQEWTTRELREAFQAKTKANGDEPDEMDLAVLMNRVREAFDDAMKQWPREELEILHGFTKALAGEVHSVMCAVEVEA